MMSILNSTISMIRGKGLAIADFRWLFTAALAFGCLSFGTTALASGDKNKVCLDDCACSGGVSFLRLQYNGPSGVTVTAQVVGTIFNSVLNNGDVFELNGTGTGGKFANNTLIILIDGIQDTSIHVSCSQPIGVGFVFGSFTVVAMASVDSGLFDTVCPFDCPCDGLGVDLSTFGQGANSCSSSIRPLTADGAPAPFVITARTQVDDSSPLNPIALGSAGSVAIDKGGTGVKSAGCSGGKGIAGSGSDMDEELAFTFDSSVLAAFIQIHLNTVNFQSSSRPSMPVASAGEDQAADSQTLVSLDGTASSSPLGLVTYTWIQISGPAVTLSDPNAVQPAFAAPAISQPTPIEFKLTVSDGQNSQSDIVQVNVNTPVPSNNVPNADAGLDIASAELVPVLLDATNTFDTDGDLLTYTWAQVSGTPVVLVDAHTAQAKFLAPDVVDDEILKFRVTVSDGQSSSSDTLLASLSSSPDEPVIYISSTNAPGFDYTIPTAEIFTAFVSDGTNRGWVDFSQFTSLPSGLLIEAFKLRETNDDLFIDFYLDCTPECFTDADCDDGVDCTINTCSPITEECVFTPDDSLCDDGNACTDGTCDAVSGCIITQNDMNSCSDGNLCTSDACVAGACVGTPVSCPADTDCRTFVCDLADGICKAQSTNEGLTCTEVNDGNVCTDEVCRSGVCTPENDNTNACTDNNLCTDDACVAGACVGTAVTCPSHTDCRTFVCDLADGICKAQNTNEGLTCTEVNDGNVCTDEVCRSGVCTPENDNTNACTDNNLCTNDACVAGACVGTAVTCQADTDCRTFVCDLADGMCKAQSTNEGLTCTEVNDGNVCTDEVCRSGVCTPENDDTNICTDNNLCTNDACVAGACVGTAVTCPSDTDCQTFVCDLADGICKAQSINEGLTCTEVNDGNVCTDEVCRSGVCTPENDDSNFCTDDSICTNDACVSGACVSTGIPGCCPLTPCEDNNPCTDDVCNTATGMCSFVPNNNNTCTDNNLCTNDACVAGVCVGTAVTCPADTDCQTFVCDLADGICKAQSTNEGLTCTEVNDGNVCTDEVCRSGVCTPENDDTNFCTDNNLCTNDACVAGGCVGTAVTCPADTDCQTFVCDLADGICRAQSINEGLTCTEVNDGNVCTDEVCRSGVCTPENDDTNFCTDNNLCTNDACVAGGCVGTAITCPADTDCQTFVCDLADGMCKAQSINEGLTCTEVNDGNVCTDEVCRSGVCTPENDDTNACTDNNLCTNDACVAGACVGTAVTCQADTDCQTFVCDLADGMCKPQSINEGLTCTEVNDGNDCTDEVCRSGVCTPENDDTNICTDNNLCTDDACVAGACDSTVVTCQADTECQTFVCDQADGICKPQPINEGIACTDDGNECTADVCRSGQCAHEVTDGAPCTDDGLECTDDLCDAIGACNHTNVTDGTVCTVDTLVCTLDVCKGGICEHMGMDEVCDDAVGCTNDLCDLIDDCVNTPVDLSCDDTIACTIDTCDPMNDCLNTPDHMACDDGVVCTIDECDVFVGCLSSPVDSLCNDGVACTIDTCNSIKDCQFVPDSSLCDDGNECTLDQCTPTGCSFTDTGLCGACCINATKSCLSDVLQGTCNSLNGLFIGAGTVCLGDGDSDGIDDLCDNCNGANDAIFGVLLCSESGIACEVDEDCGPNEVCQKACLGRIPTVSEWGLVVLTLLLLVCGKLFFGARRPLSPVRVWR